MDKNFAYILGVFMGDGCVTNQHKVRKVFKMNTIDEDFAIAVKTALENLNTKYKPYIMTYQDKRPNRNPGYTVYCVDQELSDKLVFDTNDKTKIPEYVFNWSEDLKKYFIVGLMDSEGYVAQKKTIPKDCKRLTDRSFFMGFKVCDPWALDFAKILNSIGIKIGKIRYEKSYNGTKIPIHFGIKMQSWVEKNMWFNIERKQNRVNVWKNCEPYSERTLYPSRPSSETTR